MTGLIGGVEKGTTFLCVGKMLEYGFHDVMRALYSDEQMPTGVYMTCNKSFSFVPRG